MEDQVQNNVIPEVVTQGTESHQEQKAVQTTPAEDKQEKNWRALREQNAQLQKELKEQREFLQKLSQAQEPKPVDELEQISDEEFIPKGQVKKVVQREAEKIAKSIVEQEQKKFLQNKERSEFADRLRKKYSDFDDVVNPETIALFEEKNPELAKVIASSQDPYSMALQSYEYIKATGLNAHSANARRAREVEKKLEENKNVVQTPLAYDKRPMAQAYKLTEARKTELYKEMMGYASQAPGL